GKGAGMRRALLVITVLAIAFAASGCRQIYAHRTRGVTITTWKVEGTAPPYTIHEVVGTGPFMDEQVANVSGTARDWRDTYPMPQNPWHCVGAPTTAAAVAADCTLGQFIDQAQNDDGSFVYGDEMMRHIETPRSGWVDCALTACSIVVQAPGPYYCGG